MEEINYEQIQKIDKSATKKLLKYISKEIQDENILDKLEFFYPDFGEQKHTLALNVWISIDFMGNDGRTFIEKFLEESNTSLTEKEREILRERNKSNISLFEILYVEGDHIQVMDLLQNKSCTLWDPELVKTVNSGDFILARVGNLLGHHGFIGDMSYLPPSIKPMFLEEVLIDFNRLRLAFKSLTIKQYLKKYSINLYKIYTHCIFEAMEMDDDIVSILYSELDEFEAYVGLKYPKAMVKRYIANLMDFFDYYLADEDLTLYDLDQVDFNYFFEDAIDDGFITSQEDLNSYIGTFKNYLGFLSNRDAEYKEVYKELLEISKNRFNFINQLKVIKSPFVIDKEFSNEIVESLNEDAISLIMDYDKFMLYILDQPLELTEKNKYIKRKNLLEINNVLELSNYTDKSSPNQRDFPMIHMFYRLSLSIGLLSINGNKLSVSNKGSNYLRLRDEDKYTLFFHHIWNSEFISEICNMENSNIIEKAKNDIISILWTLNENISYEIGSILSKFSNNPKFFLEFYIYLQYLGIIQCHLYPNYEIKLTSLGKRILNFIKLRDSRKHECSVINLETFKKGR